MKELKTETIINAPIEKVWRLFRDFEKYPEWNSFIQSITGDTRVGQKLEVKIQPEGKKAMTFKPVVLKNEEQKELRWKGTMGFNGLFDGEHYFIFEKIDGQTTRFIHGEKFSGILVSPIMGMINDATLAGFNSMNKALKQKAEN